MGREFSDIVESIGTHQEYKLIGKSLKGEYNATIAKLMLSKHGYVEKRETDVTTNGQPLNPYKELSTEELRKLAAGK